MGDETDTCRTCAKECTLGARHSLFGAGEDVDYAAMLRTYAGCAVSDSDRLPNFICQTCADALHSFDRFVAECRRSELKHVEQLKLDDDDDGEDRSSDESFVPQESSPHVRRRRVKTDKTQLVCKECNLTFASRSAMIVHNRKHTGERPYKCKCCDKSFAQKGTLSEHERRLHSADVFAEKRFTCDACGKRFMKRGDMLVHMRVHTKERPYECAACGRRFTQIGSLHAHSRLHTGERPHACRVCRKTFVSAHSLTRHLLVHTDVRSYVCNVCGRAVKTHTALKLHLAHVHSSPEKRHACSQCGVAFMTKGNLTVHLKKCHSEAAGVCAVCDKHFSDIADHMRVHTGDTPYECHVCGKRFPQKRSLTRHVNNHGRRDDRGDPVSANGLTCGVDGCDRAFTMRCNLDLHVLKHHQRYAPYKCQQCTKRYYRLSDLKKHVKCVHKELNIDDMANMIPVEFSSRVDDSSDIQGVKFDECSLQKNNLIPLPSLDESMFVHKVFVLQDDSDLKKVTESDQNYGLTHRVWN